MATDNNRRYQRIKHGADIRVCSDVDTVYTFEMRDFSESGIFLLCDDTSFVEVDDTVTVQTLEFDGAPVINARIARIEPNQGFAVEFILD